MVVSVEEGRGEPIIGLVGIDKVDKDTEPEIITIISCPSNKACN